MKKKRKKNNNKKRKRKRKKRKMSGGAMQENGTVFLTLDSKDQVRNNPTVPEEHSSIATALHCIAEHPGMTTALTDHCQHSCN